jgi:predicted enzyme related to lactoylglutathione lyase
MTSNPHPVVHLELHTGDLARAGTFYSRLLSWRPERIDTGSGAYLALELGGFGGAASSSAAPGARCGCRTSRSTTSSGSPTARGTSGASVLFEPREGPAGWRSVVATPEGGEIAFNVLGLRGTRITEITAFLNPEMFGRFGLPDEIRS